MAGASVEAVLVFQELVPVNLSLGSMILACFDSVKDLHVLLRNPWSFLRPINGMILCERNLNLLKAPFADKLHACIIFNSEHVINEGKCFGPILGTRSGPVAGPQASGEKKKGPETCKS